MWPFKKKPLPNEVRLDELMARVHDDVEAHGGFVIIGLNGPKVDGHDSMTAAAALSNTSKSKVIYTVASAVQMTPTDVVVALAQYRESKVGLKSPIQRADLKK